MSRWMRHGLIAIAVPVLAVSLPAAGKGDAAAGKEVYKTHCAICHGPNGEGNPNIAKRLKVTMRHLGSKEVQAKSDDELRKDITKGTGQMKPAGLKAGEVDDVIAHMRTLKEK